MGCSNSNIYVEEDTRKLTDEKSSYIIRNEKLEGLAQDILDDCIKKHNGTPQGIKEIADEIISLKNDSSTLTIQDLQEAIKDVYVQQIILSENLIKEFDIESEIGEKFINGNFNGLPQTTFNDMGVIMQNVFVNYGKTQNGIVINFSPELYLEDPSLANAFYTNLKFNQTFHCNILVLIINKNLISNENNCTQLSEVISCNKLLSTLIIKIADDVNDSSLISNLNCIFDVIKLHKSLQVVVFVNNSNEQLQLSKVIENDIVDLMKISSKLICLGIFKFALNDAFVKCLAKMIPQCLGLKALGIESEGVSENAVDEFVMNGIGRSNSLLAVVMGGFGLSDEKVRQYMQLKQGNGHIIKVFEYLKTINI